MDKARPFYTLRDRSASAEPCPRQSVPGLGRQHFHANPHRSSFAGTNQTSNSLVSLPDTILANDRDYPNVGVWETLIPSYRGSRLSGVGCGPALFFRVKRIATKHQHQSAP